MSSTSAQGWGIGEVARRTGVTERARRYYEELGLLAPARDTVGRRRYDDAALRLYRIRLLRELQTPLAELDPDAHDRTPECRVAVSVDPFGHRWMLNQPVGT